MDFIELCIISNKILDRLKDRAGQKRHFILVLITPKVQKARSKIGLRETAQSIQA